MSNLPLGKLVQQTGNFGTFREAFAPFSPRMASRNSGPRWQGGKPGRNQNTRPTHFLCFPLVNSTSAPQLAASLAEFKQAIPMVPPPVPEHIASRAQLSHKPLVPEGAHRPLGTLHITLGVMHLPTQEKLEEALSFLQSLDLESMLHDVAAEQSAIQGSDALTLGQTQPLSIDLTSLSALRNVHAATILHATPVDATSRLYPFSVRLKDKFIQAGFMQVDMANGKPKELLLHATIANTVYVKGRGRGGGGKGRKEQITFDATDLVTRFGGYVPRSGNTAAVTDLHYHHQGQGGYSGGIGQEQGGGVRRQGPPFVWARNILLDRVCICEMGAKPVGHDGISGWPALGEAYRVVGERKLNFGGPLERRDLTEDRRRFRSFLF